MKRTACARIAASVVSESMHGSTAGTQAGHTGVHSLYIAPEANPVLSRGQRCAGLPSISHHRLSLIPGRVGPRFHIPATMQACLRSLAPLPNVLQEGGLLEGSRIPLAAEGRAAGIQASSTVSCGL